ncbi:phosphonate C-P lyase system protein PhnH [Brucella sp. C7-11G]
MRIGTDYRNEAQVHEDQRVFRLLLEAFSYPGRIVELAAGQAASAVVLSTLADTRTPVWIDEGFSTIRSTAKAAHWPRADRKSSVFALCHAAKLGQFDSFCTGTLAEPHLSTTIIAEIEALAGGVPFQLSGPGVGPRRACFAPVGLPDGFPGQWRRNVDAYPLGVDLILTAGSFCACLPRSVRLEAGDVCSS